MFAAVAIAVSITRTVAGSTPSALGAFRAGGLPVLRGAWFDVSVKGSYAMQWTGSPHMACLGGPDEFISGAVSESIEFGTARPVRAYAVEVILPLKPVGPVPALFLKRSVVRTGTRLFPNDLSTLGLRTPAVYTRSLSGTYANCGVSPQTVAPRGCGRFEAARFTTFVHQIANQLELLGWPRSPLAETACAMPDDFPHLHEFGPPPFRTGNFVTGLKCPAPAAELRLRAGAAVTCPLIGDLGVPNFNSEYVCPGTCFAHEQLSVTLRRVR